MKVFAISDLHLSFGQGVEKPMDIFGPNWAGHPGKIKAAWERVVGPDDWVLVGGDVSWGLRLAEALPDLQWIGALPGTKVLIKGNHCTWWTSRQKVEAVLPPGMLLLQNNAVLLPDGTCLVGTRGWDPPGAPWSKPGDEKVWKRELDRFDLSVAAARKLSYERLVAMLHYPPRFTDGRETEFVPRLEAAGVSRCIYGHLHGKDLKSGFNGEKGGIRYHLTSCDFLDFVPLELTPW
jgi:hypothetical protein